MKYLIIGNCAAGSSAAEAIRKNDKSGTITILSNEDSPAYGRPLISYFLSGKVKAENMVYRDEDFYKSRKISVFLNSQAEKINIKEKTVKTVSGKKFDYDKLLIATGSIPFVPPIKDLNNQKNVFSFLTYDDAKKIKEAVREDSKVIIAGAGLIGLKAAEGLFGKVRKITVIDLADRVMASVLDKPAADIIQNHIERNEIDFILNASISAVEGEQKVGKVILSDGQTLECDILIIAVGVRPNIRLAKEAGIKTNKAIIVDNYMRTSAKNVYAAGDCVESLDLISNENKILALWPNATNQGEIAGFNMAGDKQEAPIVFAMNSISFLGLQLISAGIICNTDYNYAFSDSISSENKLRRLNISDDRLIGFVLINDFQRAGIYTDLINNKTKLSELEYDIKSKDIGFNIYPTNIRKDKILGKNKKEK
ncbi:MAG: FAD-dependent oxidoreductase [Elusimicrobiota bacterium]|jgi:NAD(P)H-nitrite reductase large subunit|nr:FAD-dependent oxidoreductase [Elusimicrobiota bacterium]